MSRKRLDWETWWELYVRYCQNWRIAPEELYAHRAFAVYYYSPRQAARGTLGRAAAVADAELRRVIPHGMA
jgi:hypothetical protein